jgi:dTDP-4-dehydrorhamnose 3,5-epimerase
MEVQTFAIEGLKLFIPRVFSDARGYFFESFQRERYREHGVPVDDLLQENVSRSSRNVLRGLHFQRPPMAQGKFVQVLYGRVIDVAVDLRPDSQTYGKHVMVELSEENHAQFWVPAGFAHGFLALEDETVFTYKVTALYSPEHDGGVLWNDPDLGIQWPVKNPVVSEKDARLPLFKDLPR